MCEISFCFRRHLETHLYSPINDLGYKSEALDCNIILLLLFIPYIKIQDKIFFQSGKTKYNVC